MRIRQNPPGRGSRHVAPTDADGPGHSEQDDAAWGDERQVAVWGQVSARTLYLVVTLSVVAGSVFDLIDSSRYAPCVLVFFAIALGATAYSGWTARRKGVDVRVPRATDRAQLVVSSLVSGVILYAIIRFLAEGHNRHSLLAAAVAIGFGVGTRFPEDWRRAPRGKGRAEMLGWSVGSAVASLISGAIFYGIAWYLAESFGHESWPGAVGMIAALALGFGCASRFTAVWDRRQALRPQEATTDDAPDPIL